jgi:zinc protease
MKSILVSSLCLVSFVLAAANTGGTSNIPPVKFTDTRLTNGLRVIIAEDHYAPIYSIAVDYNVGSRDERKGRTGFAHLFEHMMFKGSEKVGAGEHFFLIFNNGGNMNGTTDTDRTLYFETLPKNQLDLGLFLESDRMRSLVITKENLDNQRNAVQEERRLGLDNQPYGKTEEQIDEMTFENFAYKHSTIGSMEDLNAAGVEDVKDFFKTYYAPNNAVLVLVGDIDTQDTLARVKKFFGDIPRQTPPPSVDMTEPPQTAERRAKIDDKLARLARVDLAYKLTPGNSSDFYAMEVLAAVFSAGESSRLYQKLVKEAEVATSVLGYVDERRGPSVYRIEATVRPGKTPQQVEDLIGEEITRLASQPVNAQELDRARNSQRRQTVQTRESSLYRAIYLGEFAVAYDDPGVMNKRLEKITAVTAADVQRVAKAYMKPEQRVVIHTIPAAPPPGAGAGR